MFQLPNKKFIDKAIRLNYQNVSFILFYVKLTVLIKMAAITVQLDKLYCSTKLSICLAWKYFLCLADNAMKTDHNINLNNEQIIMKYNIDCRHLLLRWERHKGLALITVLDAL